MEELPEYYGDLARGLYHQGFELLDKLVAMRKKRGMTQAELGEAMNVSQAYISEIENGKRELVSLLTDYALEVGAYIEYKVVPAESAEAKAAITEIYENDPKTPYAPSGSVTSSASSLRTNIHVKE